MFKKIYNIKILEIFMLIQPILDIITSIMVNEFDLSISLGMIVRSAFIIYALVYILSFKDKKTLCYLLFWGIYIVTNIIGNYYMKSNFSIFMQFNSLFKMFYFPITLLFFIVYFKNNKELNPKVYIYIALIAGLSFITSTLTNTSYCSYENYDNCKKKGLVGWFNSANEYSLILIALLGFCLNSFIKKKSTFADIAFFLIVVFLCLLGTKASFIGVVGVLTLYILYYFITCFIDKNKKKFIKRIIVLIVTLGVIGVCIPKLPIYINLKSNYERAYENAINDYEDEEDIKKDIEQNMLFNGREDFTLENKRMFNKSNLFGKLFGLTTQDNSYSHINERDFHDLFIYYGIIGFVLDLFLPFLLLLNILESIIKKIKIMLNDEIVIYGIVISLILVGSYIAGHCFFQPAVSIYFAYLIALLNKKVGDLS